MWVQVGRGRQSTRPVTPGPGGSNRRSSLPSAVDYLLDGRPMESANNYLFIDANYLRRAYEDTLRRFFSDVSAQNLDLTIVKRWVSASKAFYYDAIDEADPSAEARQEHLDTIRGLPGFHVRQGTITGRARRQKRVDVQLAVDCLMHAYNKNFWHVTLIAGDLDFEPLVTALVAVGAHVHVYYESRSAAKGLYRAADVAEPLTIDTFWDWSERSWQDAHPRPFARGNDVAPVGAACVARGRWGTRPAELYELPGGGSFTVYFPATGHVASESLTYGRREDLLTYAQLRYSGLQWE